ncbi:hypothetical protein V6N12_000523 [Hibiscus sabdariffa]|uniref:CCHC-type domain-containing protein n=1 Tax=Hibiscus sabdariffa TaxID=183260 RepID=A0ABR2AVQ2_9ROSI
MQIDPPSYRDKVIGSSSPPRDDDLLPLKDDDIELLEDDVMVGETEGILSIVFSDRVQSLALKSMDFTLVIKILGRRSQPNRVVSWVRLPGLPITCFKKSMIEAIGSRIGSVVKMDFQTDNGHRGRFARLAVNINLNRPLISKISINGRIQIVEYESLPVVCFHCGVYGHTKDICPKNNSHVPPPETTTKTTQPMSPLEPFSPWMIVEKRNRRQPKASTVAPVKSAAPSMTMSRFSPIYGVDDTSMKDQAEVLAPIDLDRPAKDVLTRLPKPKTKTQVSLAKPPTISLGNKNRLSSSAAASSSTGGLIKNQSSSMTLNPNKHLVVNLVDDESTRVPPNISIQPAQGAQIKPSSAIVPGILNLKANKRLTSAANESNQALQLIPSHSFVVASDHTDMVD